MQICIFEDLHYDKLEPFTYARPAYNLYCGFTRLRDKIIRAYPEAKVILQCRSYLKSFLEIKNTRYSINEIEAGDCLFINGRILAPRNLGDIIPIADTTNKLYKNGDTIIAARVSGDLLERIKSNLNDVLTPTDFDGLPVEQVDVDYFEYMWDFIHKNPKAMQDDYDHFFSSGGFSASDRVRGKVYHGALFVEPDNIVIEEGAVVRPGAVLDASSGPIFLDKHSIVYPNAVLEGPVYIGEGTHVKSGARIYDSVSIGKVCKVGGEIEQTVMLPYSNKQHSGFMGHSYIGSWVNIGADTNCSDLKNNYGNVKIHVGGEYVDSGHQFLGLIMADHSKVAINSMFNTGTVVGFFCNIFGADFPPKFIPSFSWGGSGSITTYDLERSIETAKRVMARRNKVMHETEERLLRKVFDLTQKERRKRGYPY